MRHHNRFAIAAILALLWVVAGCASPAPTPTPQPAPAPTPIPAPVSLRIAYTSDSLGHTDPVAAVDCG